MACWYRSGVRPSCSSSAAIQVHAPLDKTNLENAIVQVMGAADKKDDPTTQEASYKTSFFAAHPSIFIISDGRRQSSTKTIASMVTKAAKAAGTAMKAPFPFRLMHSNAEFSHGRNPQVSRS